MTDSKTEISLLAVQGATQFITAYISLLWYEKTVLKSTSELVLLIYDTCTPKENESALNKVINNLAATRNWKSVIFIGTEEMRLISNNKYVTCIAKLRAKLQALEFDNIFIARDFGSFGTQLILNTYPKATHVEYGDSFGLVGNESETKIKIADLSKAPLMYLKFLIKKILFNHFPSRYKFNYSFLSMPIDWSGKYLADKKLVIPTRKFVTDQVIKLSEELQDLQAYCNRLLNNVSEESNLYLLSNFANSGFSSHENELTLYEEIILDTAKKGSTVFIKNHPRGSNVVLDLLYNRLRKNYDVRIISDLNFSMYPIELWSTLIKRCKIYPVFSSSSISLEYFYSKQVIMPLSERRIKSFIYINKIDETLQSEVMCEAVIQKLKTWDENSILWPDRTGHK